MPPARLTRLVCRGDAGGVESVVPTDGSDGGGAKIAEPSVLEVRSYRKQGPLGGYVRLYRRL